MSSIVKHIRATAVEPEYFELNVERDDDGEWLGGMLELDIADVVMIDGNGSRFSSVCSVTINLMRSDLETIKDVLK